ncbi:MAG: hypothetical protein U9O56_05200 [Campylobacterota bacterium]|nr:hypothetical protein [Campylobacterota bacterium]
MQKLCEGFKDNSINPFMIFNSNGSLEEYNQASEFLFNDILPKELYELAVSYASKNYGYTTHYFSLSCGKTNFYAILVGYEDDEHIGIELYKTLEIKKTSIKKENLQYVNIYSILEISKSTILNIEKTKISEQYDISIPEIKIDINNFMLILNSCFELFRDSDSLEIKTYIKVGEYLVLDNKKVNLIAINFISKDTHLLDAELVNKAVNKNFNIFFNDNSVSLELPMNL